MKKLTFLFLSIFIVAAVVSCSKEANDNELALLKKVPAITVKTLSAPESDNHVWPYLIPGANNGGNRTCTEVATAWGLDDPNPFYYCGPKLNYDDYEFDGMWPEGLEVTVTDGRYVSFEMEDCIMLGDKYYKVGAVIVKGSDQANVYYYEGGTMSDGHLAAPLNASGAPAGLSNLTFCFVECEKEEELIIAVKSYYSSSAGNLYCVSKGTKVFVGSEWCATYPLGINNYPSTASFNMFAPYSNAVIGEVTVENGDVTVTLNEGLTLISTYLFIGTLNDLLTSNLNTNGCPVYSNTEVWIRNSTPGTNSSGFSFMFYDL